MINRINYNKDSSEKYGWKPNWFDPESTVIDSALINSIRKWQKDAGLSADGLVGPATFRRIYTERDSDIHIFAPTKTCCKETNHIVYNGNFYEIDWPDVTLWSEDDGLICKPGTYKKHHGKRKLSFFVNHWDVCLSSKSCERVMDKRGISVHFCIDNDGRIFQLLDLNEIAWHAGGRGWNARSAGVEISNAYYPKYQSWYVKNGFHERPLVEGAKVHGQVLSPFMDFYPVQKEALKALWKAVSNATGISLEVPLHSNGKLIKGVLPDVRNVNGFVNHYNLTSRKIDCAGLDLKGMMKDVKG